MLDERTLRFADYAGNRQYITAGNLAENDRSVHLPDGLRNHTRIKLWGRARVVENDAALLARLAPRGLPRAPSARSCSTIVAWDANCPQHIPLKHDDEEVAVLRARIAELEHENAGLRREREVG